MQQTNTVLTPTPENISVLYNIYSYIYSYYYHIYIYIVTFLSITSSEINANLRAYELEFSIRIHCVQPHHCFARVGAQAGDDETDAALT